MKPGFHQLVFIFSLIFFFSVSAFSQADTYNLSGRVSDGNAAGLAGAKVVARNLASGREFAVQTAGGGAFNFSNLPSGRYSVAAESGGFSAISREVSIEGKAMRALSPRLQRGRHEFVRPLLARAAGFRAGARAFVRRRNDLGAFLEAEFFDRNHQAEKIHYEETERI